MWVRRAAIRPVPSFAVVPEAVIARIEERLANDEDTSEKELDGAFERFSTRQPALAEYLEEQLNAKGDEVATALGWFLALSSWIAFEHATDRSIDEVDTLAVAGAAESLRLDEELRRVDAAEVVDSDDIIAMEQPHLVKFVNEHIDAALAAHADEADVDAVHAAYRAVLITILALSYAVRVPPHLSVHEHGEASA